MGPLERLSLWAKALKRQALLVYFVARHPQTPWPVRLLALAVAAYALSPIDLIPDFIPVIGYIDDLILLPLGILLIVRLTPSSIIDAAGRQADACLSRPVSRLAAAGIVLLWLVLAVVLIRWLAGVLP